jgi:hypothetical protein
MQAATAFDAAKSDLVSRTINVITAIALKCPDCLTMPVASSFPYADQPFKPNTLHVNFATGGSGFPAQASTAIGSTPKRICAFNDGLSAVALAPP